MTFLRNCWYAAAWSHEIGRAPFERRLLDEPLALFRTEDGSPVAIGNICPHRFASLSHGRMVGDTLECPYHGLRFGSDGVCVHNPHGDGRITPGLKLSCYPLVERHGLAWIWMSETPADPSLIPDFSHLTDPARAHVQPTPTVVQAHYELVTDNLMDLSHVIYVHRSSYGAHDFAEQSNVVRQDDGVITSAFEYRAGHANLAVHLGDPAMLVDTWFEMEWRAPSALMLHTGATPAGTPRAEGVSTIGTHILTPESEISTHYFICNSRTFAVDDEKVDLFIKTWQENALRNEDKVILEQVQRNMGTTDLLALRPALLANDGAAMRVRRQLAKLIRSETAGSDREIVLS